MFRIRFRRPKRLLTLLLAVSFLTTAQAQTAHLGGMQTPFGAVLNDPQSVTVDSNNNVYVLDRGTMFGIVYESTLVGESYVTSEIFSGLEPNASALAVDNSGNLYVVDSGAGTLAKYILSNGSYTRKFIVSGVSQPLDVAVDAAQNVYLTIGSQVLKFTFSNGSYIQSVAVGSGFSPGFPSGIAVDGSGNLYIVDQGANAIKKATFSDGIYTLSTLLPSVPVARYVASDSNGNLAIAAGSGLYYEAIANGTYTETLLATNYGVPYAVGIDSNHNVYVANASTQIIQQSPPPGNFQSVSIGNTSATQTLAFVFDMAGSLNSTAPVQVLTQGAGGLDYTNTGAGTCGSGTFTVGETCTVTVNFTPKFPGARNGAVVLNGSAGDVVATGYITGNGLGPQLAFSPIETPIISGLGVTGGVATDGVGNVYIADTGNNRVVKETLSGGTYTETPIGSGLAGPQGVAVDGAGNVYIADTSHLRILKETLSDGAYVQSTVDNFGGSNVAVDNDGNVYMTDNGSEAVYKETPSGGSYIRSTISYLITSPDAIAVDSSGNVYVTDLETQAVFKETKSGGSYIEAPLISNLTAPRGITVDAIGNLYISDGNLVYKETLSGGTYTQTPITSDVSSPEEIAVDGSGNIYIADYYNKRVLFETVTTGPTLQFPPTTYGTTSGPLAAVLTNIGNQALTFPAPTAGTNPTVPPVVAIETNADTTCPVVAVGGTAGSLAPGASCAYSYVFTPTNVSTLVSGSNVTSNSLNRVAAQKIPLDGSSIRAAQIITFTPPTSVVYVQGEAIALSGTSTSGLQVQVRLVSGPASLSGSRLTLTGAGTVVVSANQNGTSDYSPAVTVTQNIVVTAPPPTSAGFADTAVGSSRTAQTVMLVLLSGVTLNASAIQVLTQGAPNLDFAYASGGSCVSGQSYIAYQTCTVNVIFSPKYSGTRYGAVVLNDPTGNAVATTFLQGNGLGPQIAFAPPLPFTVATGLNDPETLAIDSSGDVFITDSEHSQILKEIPFAGAYSVNPVSGTFNDPLGLAVDGAGGLYVIGIADTSITKVTPSGSTYFQSSIGSGFNQAVSIAVDGSGNVYVADKGSNSIIKETLSGGVYTQSTIASGFGFVTDVAVDGNGNVYVSDPHASKVYKETLSNGTYTQSSIGSNLDYPYGVSVDGNGNVYITDLNTALILKETPSGGTYTQSTVFADTSSDPDLYTYAAVDTVGNLYIVDNTIGQVLEENVQGPSIGFAQTATGTISAAQTVTVTNIGNEVLDFLSPSDGINPSTASNFVLESDADTTCPLVNVGSPAGVLTPTSSCTLSYLFAPGVVGRIKGSSVLTDNNLNAASATQTVELLGQATQGTQIAQTINFLPPTQILYPGSATLTATASSGLAVSYSVVSGPATLAGSTLTYTGPGTVIVQATQDGNVQYGAAPPVSVTLNVALAQAFINWQPSTLKIYTGTPLGDSVLDATDSIPGTVTYSAYLEPSGTPFPVTSSTVLQQGSYGLTATITPTDTTHYAITSITLLYTVQNMNVFVANVVGSTSSFYNNGQVQSIAQSGGGIGAAVDSFGNFWSLTADGSGVSKFTDSGASFANYSNRAGINSAKALAVDGLGKVWIANNDGTISVLTNDGAQVSSTTIAAAGNINVPASLTVDAAGSLWIANAGNNTVTEVIGVAAPVTTPTAQSIVNDTPGARP
jgi:streptogramin lyase